MSVPIPNENPIQTLENPKSLLSLSDIAACKTAHSFSLQSLLLYKLYKLKESMKNP